MLVSRRLLSSDEEEQLVGCLPWIDGTDDWLRALCAARLTSHHWRPASSHPAGDGTTLGATLTGARGGDTDDRFAHPALAPLLGVGTGGDCGDQEDGDDGKQDESAATRADPIMADWRQRQREPNVHVLAAQAELLWSQHDSQGAHSAARKAFELEPLCDAALPVFLASMVELGLKQDLFLTAHQVHIRALMLVHDSGFRCHVQLL